MFGSVVVVIIFVIVTAKYMEFKGERMQTEKSNETHKNPYLMTCNIINIYNKMCYSNDL